jgi:uncharacterized protein
MTTKNPRQIYVNLAVRDLPRAIAFFRALDFEFNPQFTDENAACMILSDQASVMLLTESFFRRFTKRALSDPHQQTEALLAISCCSRAEVDQLVKSALAAGGSPAMDPQDHGFMYAWSFYDPDGHHWEVLWMDPQQMPQPEARG